MKILAYCYGGRILANLLTLITEKSFSSPLSTKWEHDLPKIALAIKNFPSETWKRYWPRVDNHTILRTWRTKFFSSLDPLWIFNRAPSDKFGIVTTLSSFSPNISSSSLWSKLLSEPSSYKIVKKDFYESAMGSIIYLFDSRFLSSDTKLFIQEMPS